jgi:hypothetical protein
MRLSDLVTRGDVEEAIRLMKVATQTAATDPRTGTIDMDMITTGRTASERDFVLHLVDEVPLNLFPSCLIRSLCCDFAAANCVWFTKWPNYHDWPVATANNKE